MNAWDDPRIARGMRAQLAERRRRIAAGERPLGWKIGFGAAAAMERLGISAPLVGYLMHNGLLHSGARASLAGWTKPVAEPEIAVYVGADLPGGADRAATRAAIAAIGPAIELADLDQPPEEVETILTGNIFQRHVVLGPREAARAGAGLDGLIGRVLRNGREVAVTSELQANTGDVVDLVRHVASLLAAFGERLSAGDVVITGSVVPPLFLDPEDTAITFELAPIGEAAVHFHA
jgi:2-keto-4-pentenoate hydratase